MGHTRLQGRTHRERTKVARRRQKLTSRIRTSGIYDGNLRQDSRGRGKRRYLEEKENSSEENNIGGWIEQEGERRKSYSAAVIYMASRASRRVLWETA